LLILKSNIHQRIHDDENVIRPGNKHHDIDTVYIS